VSARLLLCAVLALGAAACSDASAEGSASSRGFAALEQGKPSTARIEFLNAIKADPNNGGLRILQARTYIALRDGLAAEEEIKRARQLGVDPGATRHLMAEAYLLQGQPQRALDEAALAPPAAAKKIARIRAQALVALGDSPAAGAAFEEALALAPDDAGTWAAAARFRRSSGDLAGALQAIDRAVKLDPRSADALTLRGELTRKQYGLRAAIPWFDRALEIDPDNVVALLERAATYGDMGAMNAMLGDTRKVLALTANKNAMAYYLQAMLAARAQKFDLARSLYLRTGGALGGTPAGMLLASAIDYQTGNAEQAIGRLEKLVALQPGNRKARRLLAASYWKRGDAARTIAALRPIADLPDADNYSLALIGKALAKQGDTQAASIYLARAARPQPRPGTLLSEPVDDERLDALRREATARPGDAPAQVSLIGALLSRGLGAEALERAQRLQADNPGAPDAHILVGDALGIQGDFRGAAEQYRKAANIAFSEPVAMRMIEALDRSGQAAAAAQVLQLFLEQNPRNVSAQLLAATRYMQARQWDAAIATYEDLRRRLGDRDSAMLNNLAWAYSERGEFERAIPLARRAWELDRDNPATTDTLGWILFKSGEDRVQGLALLARAARGAPSDAQIRAHLDRARKS
jgi:tetratricopeptide (TPR) repeat protein